MYLESKVMCFQSEPERSVSNHEGFYQDSSDKGNTMGLDMFVRKDCTLVIDESVEIATQ